jgi:erythrocyte band 7 integral membrane protein
MTFFTLNYARKFQTLNTISAEKNSTIVFPLPIDILTYFMKARDASNAAASSKS